MPKFALELRHTVGKPESAPADAKPVDLLGVYLVDDKGHSLELRKPEELTGTLLGYAAGFVSIWPVPIGISFHSSSAGYGYRAGHNDACRQLERYVEIPRSKLERLFGQSPSALELFFAET